MQTPFFNFLALIAAATVLAACGLTDPNEPGKLVPATVDQDASLPSIKLNGAFFHAETFGDPSKPVIVFLHGGPGGDYRGLLSMMPRYDGYSLADDHLLVFWDQRGCGLSQRFDKSKLTLDIYDADLDAVIQKYSPTRPVFLIGQSWGGMYATEYVNRHPQRVAGLVLIEPGPFTGTRFDRLKADITNLDLFSSWLNDAVWSGQFISPDGHARMDYNRLLGLRESQPKSHERKDVDPEPVWRLGAAASRYILENGAGPNGKAEWNWTTNLSQFTTPVLFIAGELSEVLGPSLQQEQMHDYPSATLAVVPGAGHDAHWTKPAPVVSLIRAYLAAREVAQ